MNIKFTPMQEKSITTKDCSLLISAGAGSGKTAVLTERIIQRLTDADDDFETEDFIAVTFTKAAAGELKERLYKKLSEYIISFPENKKALRQLAKLQNASVSTIHSFCFDLVSRNFSKLSLSPDMYIGDENENALVMRRLLDDILENLYDSENTTDDSFADFADTFAGAKSDEGMTQMILNLYNKIRKNPSIENSFDSAIEKYDEIIKKAEYFDCYYGKIAKSVLLKELEKSLSEIKNICRKAEEFPETKEAYLPAFEEDLNNISFVLKEAEKGYTDAASALLSLSAAPVKRLLKFPFPEFSQYLRQSRADVFKRLSKLSVRYFLATKEEIDLAAKKTKKLVICLKDIILTLDKAFTDYKISRGILDFNDLERYALSLLYDIDKKGNLTPSLQAKAISERIKEIYIDEYQDINPIQDLIFRAITKYGKDGEQNRFMVGDKKQSIYRFRGSEPDIFHEYCSSFSDLQSDKKQKRIFLSDNFRCSENVIDTVNFLFESIMGKDYSDMEKLIHSRIENTDIPKIPCELMITKPCSFHNPDGEVENSDRTEAEAYSIAMRIKETVHNPAYLKSNGEMFGFGDVTILLRSMKGAGEVFEKVLKKCGIPAKSERPEAFFDKREISLAVSFLNAIDNPERDIHLAAVLKSPVYSFSADQLFEIKAGKEQKKLSLYSSLVYYAENGKNQKLREKVNNTLEMLLHFCALARSLPCDSLIRHLYTETSLLQICSSKAFGCNTVLKSKSAYNSLLKLYTLARDFSGDSYKGLFAFIDYISDLASREVSFEENMDSQADHVKIMSIHHSKGLEFPMCIVANLSKKFNTGDEKQFLIADDKAGIACKLKDETNGFYSVDTPFRQAVAETSRADAREEEKRVLYVALTRARDMLILSAGEKDPEKLLQSSHTSKDSQADADNYLEWILNCLKNSSCLSAIYSRFGIDLPCSDTTLTNDKFIVKYLENSYCLKYAHLEKSLSDNDCGEKLSQKELYTAKEIEEALNHSYDNKLLSQIPAKLTVSKLKIGLLDYDDSEKETEHESIVKNQTSKDVFPDKPKFLSGFHTPTPAEKGTAMHLFMQFANFLNAKQFSSEKEAENLVKKSFISQETKDMLEYEPLDKFFASDLYNRISVSPFVKREMRFNLKMPVEEISELCKDKNEFVLVQGVIDCFFENPDGSLTVLDFKTDRLYGQDAENTLIRRHKPQLLYYCRAAEEITGKKVKEAILYSFSLNKEILVDNPENI